ncbi:uncharacterized protein LOC135702988 [Ochlerotatus camptorhynchus]|uniref:uncharacterized protein LOC135702988 n=1 Tax=Ochlerotatus camptorhynchus TaxID=644619 RepID=UPI0031D41F52
MYSQYRDSIWNKIRMQNSDMNSGRVDSSADTEWDLSQIELQEERSPQSIPTIELVDEDEVDAGSVHVVHNIPINVQRSTPMAPAVDPDIRLARRSIHEYRGIFPGTARSVVQEGATVSPTPSGIILNRVYHKNPTPLKDNYFSIMDTPPSPGTLPAAVIFGDRPVSTEPKIVMTANHYEKRIRRSFDKSGTITSGKASRQEKNNRPYKLLGVIDLEPDTESDTTLSCTQSVAGDEPKLKDQLACRDLGTPTNSALLGSSSTSRSIKDGGNKLLTIEIDEDEIQEEDTRMELSEEEDKEPAFIQDTGDQPMPGTSKENAGVKLQMDQCTLTGSDTSSTAQMNPSSMANSFWDVSSSGCMKKNNDHASTSSNRGNKYTEFDLMLDKINQQVPAMSQQDRVEHWRVTKEDLLCSIPTVAEIESGTSVKRPMDEPIHISSSDSSSDSETSDSPSLLRERQLREKYKKRRMAVDASGAAVGDRSSPSLLLSEELDFRRSQLNPEIDKGPKSMIQVRKHYYKFPTRFDPTAEEKEPSGKTSADPYATFLKDEKEKEKFTGYLRRNPAYRPDLLSPMRHLPVGEGNKVAVVVLSPLKLQNVEVNSNLNNSTTNRSTAESERPKSADRISHYGKSRTKAKSVAPVSRKLRYKVRKSQLKKKKSIMVVSANLRSYRRLVMKAGYSLRSGKIRKKPSFVNLISSSNRQQKIAKVVPQTEREPKPVQPIRRVKPVPVEPSSRVSVDSAVSSSTSAEQNKRRDAPEVVDLPPCPAPSELRTMKNPLSRVNGEVQMIFYAVNVLIVVQQELISFWECSKLASLLGLNQELQLLGQLKRAQSDSLVDPTNLNRLGFNEDEAFYLEPRARNLDEDEARLCPLASIYVNCYFVGSEENKDTQCLRMKSLQLDSVRSEISEILFTTLPRSRYFIICWHELLAENEHRTGLCKYSLTPDLETLASIREFPTVSQKIVSLKCLDDERLIGLGSSTVTIWNYDNGCLEFTVDLKMEIQTPLASFVHSEQGDSALFLIQMCPSSGGNPARKTIKILAINMNKRSWHVVQSYDVSLESSCILSESSTLNGPGLHCTTFQSGELLAISLDDLTTCFTNHKRLQGPDGRRITRDNVATREKIFLNSANGRQLVLVSDKSIKLRTIDEYALECR